MRLSCNSFFDLTDFSHRELFQEELYVWCALINLKNYLNKQSPREEKITSVEGVFLENEEMIFLENDVHIERGAYIRGPCWLGEGTQVRHGASIRGYLLTGRGCIIGHGTEVKHSIFLNRARAPHFNYVSDSILGNEVNLGAGAKCANLRFDRKPISIYCDGHKIETGLNKMGAILGDHAQMGCNSVANPGTLLLPKMTCPPCANIRGFCNEQS